MWERGFRYSERFIRAAQSRPGLKIGEGGSSMKKSLLGLGVILAFAIMLVSSGSASVNFVTIDSKGTLSVDNASATITGTTVCTAGDTASATAVVTQTSGNASVYAGGSSGDFTCTGVLQQWAVVVNVLVGTPFKHGKASAIAEIDDSTDSSFALSMPSSVGLH